MIEDMVNPLRNLLAYFIERQRLVVLAMIELNPKLLIPANSHFLGIELKPYIVADNIRQSQDTSSLQHGIWKQEWKYRLHGLGCQLINLNTQEILEWDAPDPRSFRVDWFWQHLEWRFQHENRDPNVNSFRNQLLEQPHQANLDFEHLLNIFAVKQNNGIHVLIESQ